MKILIIEDCKVTRALYAKLLGKKFELQFEVDGLNGFFEFQRGKKSTKPYDLIISDISMPYMDGAQGLKMIRLWEKENKISRWEGIPILISTQFEKYDFLLNIMGFSCDAIIFKPFTAESLLTKIYDLAQTFSETEIIKYDLKSFHNMVLL